LLDTLIDHVSYLLTYLLTYLISFTNQIM